ncbi:acyl-CoA thioester hydrolase [Allosphingosinicella indica]|uniref:Acyl-CoA thioester hydrolase n=1 Tax=Allosphingosinicella indica TaxID=941907 RepID=A0A1X7G0Y0_9SPHN|nr:acyl-CoA thioester hydrolase [Allosphingosinicella indica]
MTLPDGFRFATELRVRFSEVDTQQVVFNPNYLIYADIALTEYLRAIGQPVTDPMSGDTANMYAVRSEVDFRASARFDDVLTLATRTERIGRSSFTVLIAMLRDAERIADVRMVYVNADPVARKGVPLPPRFVDQILAYETTPPERG